MSPSLQMEHGQQPRACPDCRGEGTIAVRGCEHQGACPCGGKDFPCDACKGSGVVPCSGCGKPSVTTDADGDWCRACATPWSWPCPICDAVEASVAAYQRERVA